MSDISIDKNKKSVSGFLKNLIRPISKRFTPIFPKRLFPRTMLIILGPLVILQIILAFVFMERHWERVTKRLSTATVNNIAAIIKLYEEVETEDQIQTLQDIAQNQLGLNIQFLPSGDLPRNSPKPFFDILDKALTQEINSKIKRKFWIDTVGRSQHVEIRIELDDSTLRVITLRNQTYASNSHIFLMWMLGSSLVLLTISLIILRNQIRPIVALSEAAEAFGKGRPGPSKFQARGAQEIREASMAFIKMRDRIERHVDQRTTMLAGVSHDLRTILTRLTLELEFLENSDTTKAMRSDINEMHHMLEDYLAFAKGTGKEESRSTDLKELLAEIQNDNQRVGQKVEMNIPENAPMFIQVRRQALKRAINNLLANAARLANHVELSADLRGNHLYFFIDDDGPGIPVEQRKAVFHPFYRLDHARNQNQGNTGLGLAITRDIIHTHGGNITLEDSPLGGLRASFYIPI